MEAYSYNALISSRTGERFMIKFVDKVKSILESTQVVGKKRDDILKELFSNIATEIEDPVRGMLLP